MERIPNGRYTKEFRQEAVKMATDGGLSVLEVSKRLSLPKSTLESWIRVSKTGNLGKIGRDRRPLTELERELANVKRELALTKMERDILKNRPKGPSFSGIIETFSDILGYGRRGRLLIGAFYPLKNVVQE